MKKLLDLKETASGYEDFIVKAKELIKNGQVDKKLLMDKTRFLDDENFNKITIFERLSVIWLGANQISKCLVCGKNSSNYNILSNKKCYLEGTIFTPTCGSKKCVCEIRKQTWLDKYGVDNPTKSKIIVDKIKNTFVERYGQDWNWKIPEVLEKRVNSFNERYGVDNPSKSNEVKILIEKTKLENKLKKFKKTFKNLVNVLSIDSNTKKIRCECLECKQEFIIEPSLMLERKKLKQKICVICNPHFISPISLNLKKEQCSFAEKDVLNFIKTIYNGVIIQGSRQILERHQEIDIYLPELNLGFEFNGNYWHSKHFKDKYYHQNKKLESYKKGVDLIHIWEYDWNLKREFTQNKIKDVLENNIRLNDKYIEDFDWVILSKYLNNGFEIDKINEPEEMYFNDSILDRDIIYKDTKISFKKL